MQMGLLSSICESQSDGRPGRRAQKARLERLSGVDNGPGEADR